MVSTLDSILPEQHLTLYDVSWEYYEQTLREIGHHHLQITFLDGTMEIMSPLPEHEAAKEAISTLIKMLTFALQIPIKCFGSTTFRKEKKKAGSEPDSCFYFNNRDRAKGMKRWDPDNCPAPDLFVEVDVFSRSVSRETIFARLGVPELWRFYKGKITIRHLGTDGTYSDSAQSQFLPPMPMDEFCQFVQDMMEAEDETAVLGRFRDWVLSLPKR